MTNRKIADNSPNAQRNNEVHQVSIRKVTENFRENVEENLDSAVRHRDEPKFPIFKEIQNFQKNSNFPNQMENGIGEEESISSIQIDLRR